MLPRLALLPPVWGVPPVRGMLPMLGPVCRPVGRVVCSYGFCCRASASSGGMGAGGRPGKSGVPDWTSIWHQGQLFR